MKTFTSILVLVVLGGGLWWWGQKNDMGETARKPAESAAAEEFCYFSEMASPDSEFSDKYSLRFNYGTTYTEKEGVYNIPDIKGELKLLPSEKDALVGKFSGNVVLDNKMTWNDLGEFIWNTEGESMTARQELKILFTAGVHKGDSAKIGFGEMTLREDGVYVYKDPENIDYSLAIPKISCEEFNEREAVEKYLWEKIVTLSPIAPALGGNWYVVSAELDLEKNSGTVTYEDGHIQEKRDFTYVLGTDGAVESLTIE